MKPVRPSILLSSIPPSIPPPSLLPSVNPTFLHPFICLSPCPLCSMSFLHHPCALPFFHPSFVASVCPSLSPTSLPPSIRRPYLPPSVHVLDCCLVLCPFPFPILLTSSLFSLPSTAYD